MEIDTSTPLSIQVRLVSEAEPSAALSINPDVSIGLILAFFRNRVTTEAQRAQRKISYEPIGRRRLAHKPSCFRNEIIRPGKSSGAGTVYYILEGRKAFYLAGTSQPNKKFLLCVLRASVVKNLFWTEVIFYLILKKVEG